MGFLRASSGGRDGLRIYFQRLYFAPQYSGHLSSLFIASEVLSRRTPMSTVDRTFHRALLAVCTIAALGAGVQAQESEGPQTDAPPPVAHRATPREPGRKLTVPSGTRLA